MLFLQNALYYNNIIEHLFSVAVARGGRIYGLDYPQETVDWAPRGPGGWNQHFPGDSLAVFGLQSFYPTIKPSVRCAVTRRWPLVKLIKECD